MKWLISDTNIFIDMESGNLLQVFFQLPETFAVPDILYHEELAQHHADLPGLGLQVLEIKEEFMLEADRLRNNHRGPSVNDILALALAKQENCPLLSGDKLLRAAAKKEAVEVRGTLWLTQRMLDEELIDTERVTQAYEKMKSDLRRLPWDKVAEQIKKYKK